MSFAPTRSRGARLKARFAVNGIQSSSSERSAGANAAAAAAGARVSVMGRSRRGRRGVDESRRYPEIRKSGNPDLAYRSAQLFTIDPHARQTSLQLRQYV